MSILPAHNSLVLLCLHNKAPWLDSTKKKRGPTAFSRKAFNELQDWQIGSHITPLINSVEVLHTPSARHSLPFSNILLQDGDLSRLQTLFLLHFQIKEDRLLGTMA